MNTEYNAKIERILFAIAFKQTYFLLQADDEYYSLVQFDTDRIPVPVLKKLLVEHASPGMIPAKNIAEAIGYAPEVVIHRDTKIETKRNSLINDLVKEMLKAQEDASNPGWWRFTDDGVIRICTWPSTDDRLERNGGNYSYFREFRTHKLGVMAEDYWSCDIQDCAKNATLYRLAIDDLSKIYERACAIVESLSSGEKAECCPCCGGEFLI